MHRLILWGVNVGLYLRHARLVAIFRRRVGYFPNIAAPTRRSERLFWRKVFDHNPEFVTVSDKAAVKEWVADRGSTIPPVETLWCGTDPSTIAPELLARPTILKATHGSNFNMVLPAGTDPSAIDVGTTDEWLSQPYSKDLLEWSYQHVVPQLILEPDVGLGDNGRVTDLAIHTSNGEPSLLVLLDEIKTPSAGKGYFHPDGRRLPEMESLGSMRHTVPLGSDRSLPPCTGELIDVARDLAASFDYARVDFFIADDVAYFGEITIYPSAGLMNAEDFAAYDVALNDAWDLRTAWFFRASRGGLLGAYQRAVAKHLDAAKRPRGVRSRPSASRSGLELASCTD